MDRHDEDPREAAGATIAAARDALARHRPDPDTMLRSWRQPEPEPAAEPGPFIPPAVAAQIRRDALRAGQADEARRGWRALARREADKAVKRYAAAAEEATARFVVKTMRAERAVFVMRHAEAERRIAELEAQIAELTKARAAPPALRVVEDAPRLSSRRSRP